MMNCDKWIQQVLRKYGGAISGWLLGAESNTLVCWMSLALQISVQIKKVTQKSPTLISKPTKPSISSNIQSIK